MTLNFPKCQEDKGTPNVFRSCYLWQCCWVSDLNQPCVLMHDVYPNSVTDHSFCFQGLLLVTNLRRTSSSFMNTLCQAQKVNLSTSPSGMISCQLSDNLAPTDGLNMQALLHSNHNLEALHKTQDDILAKIQEKASNITSNGICRLSNSASKRSYKI